MPDIIDQLGEALKDRYKIEYEIGRGGTAIVYLAYDWKHSRKVAIKVLRPELGASIGAKRFLKEIATAAQLQHPRILGMHDSGDADGLLYYVMPFVEGESLRDRMERDEKIKLEEALVIIREVADGLGHAHSLGIVHRDVKPENIMITGGHAIVTDFGIARALDEAGADRLTETGLAIGTPMYMSPEQATGAKIDQRTDVYSLACVLYEMLIAEPPFTGPSAKAIMLRHSMDPVPSMRTVHAEIPPVIEQAIMKALAKTPADRFFTADQFVEALSSEEIPAISGAVPALGKHLVPVAAMLGIAVLAAVAWIAWPRPAATSTSVTTDPRIVAVFPFGVTSGDPSLGVFHNGIPEMIRQSLTGDPRPLAYDLAVIRNTVDVQDGEQVSVADAMRIAREVGAGRALHGTVIGTGGSMQLSITLHDVESGTELAVASVAAMSDRIEEAVARLTVAPFLSALVGAPSPPDSAVDIYDVEALWSFFAGHSALRVGAYDDAVSRFEEALSADTSLVAAAAGRFLALHYGSVRESRQWEDALRDVAGRLDRLDDSDRSILVATFGSLPTARPTARGLLESADGAVGSGPEGLGLLADQLMRYGAYVGDATWRDRAARALNRITDDQWSATTVWQDLVLRAVLGDSSGVVAARDRFARVSIDSALADVMLWIAAVALDDQPMLDTLRSRTDDWSSRARWAEHLGFYSSYLSASLDDWTSAVEAIARQQVTTTDRVRALSQQFAIAVTEGNSNSASNLMSELLRTARTPSAVHMAAPIVLAAAGETGYEAVAEQAARTLGSDESYASQCYVGIHDVVSGGAAVQIAVRLRQLAGQQDPEYGGLCAVLVSAIGGGAGPEELESRMREGPIEPGWELGNLILAQQWAARGDTVRAIAAVRRRAVHADWIVLMPVYRRLERALGSGISGGP